MKEEEDMKRQIERSLDVTNKISTRSLTKFLFEVQEIFEDIYATVPSLSRRNATKRE